MVWKLILAHSQSPLLIFQMFLHSYSIQFQVFGGLKRAEKCMWALSTVLITTSANSRVLNFPIETTRDREVYKSTYMFSLTRILHCGAYIL